MVLTWEQRERENLVIIKWKKGLMIFLCERKCPRKNIPIGSEYIKLSLINCGLLHNSSINFGSGRRKAEELFS